jgi:hypothetical protein
MALFLRVGVPVVDAGSAPVSVIQESVLDKAAESRIGKAGGNLRRRSCGVQWAMLSRSGFSYPTSA